MSEGSNGVVMMRINVSGFGSNGKAATVFAAFDPSNDVLLIAREAEAYESSERPGFLHITNQARDEHHDAVFTDDDTHEAITAYLELDGLGLLTISPKVQRLTPSNKIERDGMDSSGMKYRIQPDISNGQVAVLAACLYANRQRSMGAITDFNAEMALLFASI